MPWATICQRVTNSLLRGYVKAQKSQRRARKKAQATYDWLSQQLRADCGPALLDMDDGSDDSSGTSTSSDSLSSSASLSSWGSSGKSLSSDGDAEGVVDEDVMHLSEDDLGERDQ